MSHVKLTSVHDITDILKVILFTTCNALLYPLNDFDIMLQKLTHTEQRKSYTEQKDKRQLGI